MTIPVRVEPATAPPGAVEYRWDADTDILTAHLSDAAGDNGPSGSVDVEGSDGSWLIFDVAGGAIRSVEVAVWPPVRKRSTLSPPSSVDDVAVRVGQTNSDDRISALEVDAPLVAEADHAERTIHFRLGTSRSARTVRIANGVLLDIDGRGRLVGVWLLDVPPFPEDQ